MKIRITCKGTAALLMHNIRLADPLDSETKHLSELIGAKKAKERTEEDHIAISRAEYVGGLYYDDTIIDQTTQTPVGPYVPTTWLEAALKKGGGLSREGTKAQRALLFLEEQAVLDYAGPRDLAGLWSDPEFRSR